MELTPISGLWPYWLELVGLVSPMTAEGDHVDYLCLKLMNVLVESGTFTIPLPHN